MPAVTLDLNVVDLVDTWASKTPDAAAAEWQGERLSYSQLRHASLHVSSALLASGVGPGSKIPLLTQLSLEMLPSIVGILRTGACYVPIDTVAWSRDRIDSALESVGSGIVVVTSDFVLQNLNCIRFEQDWMCSPFEQRQELILRNLYDIRASLKPEDLAYIIFTSGTTGKPKGVMVPHRAILNLVLLKEGDVLKITPGKRILLLFSIGFDGCAGIVWNTLSNGGTLAMATSSDFPRVSATCHTLILTPSMLASLTPSSIYDEVTEIYLGGEAPSPAVVKQWITNNRSVYNSYGPSEATVAVTVCKMHPDEDIVLGEVIPGVRIVLLDEDLNEAETGEICITGPCLANGYINNQGLTQKKFITWRGERYYRSGDRARRSPRGLAWAGRVDRQVKNRGFLINLESEVEPALLQHPEVQAATAFMWQSKMIGCVKPASVDVSALRDFMRGKFDHFVIPDEIVPMDQFPLTTNGKVDWNSLKSTLDARLGDNVQDTEVKPGMSPVQVLRIGFAITLQMPLGAIAETSSFSWMGGNSLTAVKLSQFLRKHGISIPIGQILILDKLEKIGQALEDQGVTAESGDIKARVEGSPPMTPLQVRMVRDSLATPDQNCIVMKLTFNGPAIMKGAQFKQLWTKVLQNRDIFNMEFDQSHEKLVESKVLNFSWTEIEIEEQRYETAIEEQRQRMWLDVKAGKMTVPYNRMVLVSVAEKKATIIWQLHHTLTDGWSFGILLNDFEKIVRGDTLPKSPRYDDFARYLQDLHEREYESASHFWKSLLARVPTIPVAAFKAPEITQTKGVQALYPSFKFQKRDVDVAARSAGVSAASIAYAAWAITLAELTQHADVSFRLSLSGRMVPYEDVQNLVGPLNTRPPLVLSVDRSGSKADFLASVQQTLYQVSDYQWSSTDKVHDLLGEEGVEHFQSAMVVFFDVPSMPLTWTIDEDQIPSVPLLWRVMNDGDRVELQLRYYTELYDHEAMKKVADSYATAFEMLITERDDGTLRETCNRSREALSL